MVLAHELAHFRRGDLHWAWIRRLVNALLFFHPLVWVAEAKATLAEELACDEAAVGSATASASAYASTLLKVIEGRMQTQVGAPTLATLGMGRAYRAMATRLQALQPAPRLRFWSSRQGKLLATALASLAVLGLVLPGLFSFVRRSGIEQIDPRYPVLGFKVSRGQNHTLLVKRQTYRFAGLTFSRYAGGSASAAPGGLGKKAVTSGSSISSAFLSSPSVGAPAGISGWLRSAGLNPIQDQWDYRMTTQTTGDSCAIMVRLALSREDGSCPDMEALLEDERGEIVALNPSRDQFPAQTGECVKCWIIDPAPIARASFSLRLKQTNGGAEVAVLRLGKL